MSSKRSLKYQLHNYSQLYLIRENVHPDTNYNYVVGLSEDISFYNEWHGF